MCFELYEYFGIHKRLCEVTSTYYVNIKSLSDYIRLDKELLRRKMLENLPFFFNFCISTHVPMRPNNQ